MMVKAPTLLDPSCVLFRRHCPVGCCYVTLFRVNYPFQQITLLRTHRHETPDCSPARCMACLICLPVPTYRNRASRASQGLERIRARKSRSPLITPSKLIEQ